MKLITVNEVSYNAGQVVGASTGKVVMNITGFNHVVRNGHSIEVEYNYQEEGTAEVVGAILKHDVFKLATKEEIDGFYEQIKGMLPADLSHTEKFEALVLIGAKVKMAETFGIQITDITELV